MTAVLSGLIRTAAVLALTLPLCSCDGIFSGIYDEPDDSPAVTVAGRTYVDASDWTKWYYIDFEALADSVTADPGFNTSTLWQEYDIPVSSAGEDAATGGKDGIYTYWFDVFGAGVSNHRFESFTPTAPQPEPEHWSLAVHRNNVRTNGGSVAPTGLKSFDELPDDPTYYDGLVYTADTWNQTNVWVVQDRMLLGYVGSQGIGVNTVLSSWLTMDIPPMPPIYSHNDEVFILRLKDGSRAAVRLQNYRNATGTACCLTVNYRYPV